MRFSIPTAFCTHELTPPFPHRHCYQNHLRRIDAERDFNAPTCNYTGISLQYRPIVAKTGALKLIVARALDGWQSEIDRHPREEEEARDRTGEDKIGAHHEKQDESEL